MNRILCLLISVICLFNASITSLASEEPRFVYVYANTSAQDEGLWLPLLDVKKEAYISAQNASLLSGMKYRETDESAVFTKGYHEVAFMGKKYIYNDVVYYELTSLMDALSTTYKYDLDSQTLYFIACNSFLENLVEDCKEVYDDNYELAYLDNVWGYGTAALYNIIGGMRVDVIWGGYQKEQYEMALREIMQPDTSMVNFVETSIKGNSLMSKLSTLYKANQTSAGGIEEYCGLFGLPYDDYLEAYDAINEFNPDFDIADFLDVAQNVYATHSAYNLYVEAVKNGLYQNSQIDNNNLKIATDETFLYYDDKIPKFAAVFLDVTTTLEKNVTTEFLKEQILETGCGINSLYVKITKTLFDELGMKDRTKALEQTHVCSEIQMAAKIKYKKSLKDSGRLTLDEHEARIQCAKDIKYCTLLHLRACQYAYSLYEFDNTLQWCAEYWGEKTEKAIKTISKYSDDELSKTTKNERLNISQDGFYESNITPEQLSEIYDIMADSVLYMYTNGGTSKKDGYQYDINGDGHRDWVVNYEDTQWLFCTSGVSQINTTTWDGGNAYVHLYDSKEKKQLIIQQGKGLSGYIWEAHIVYDKEQFVYMAEKKCEYNDETQGYGEFQYKVDGEKVEEKMYEQRLQSLGELMPLETTPLQFQRNINIDKDSIEYMLSVLQRHSLITGMKTLDINGDGQEEYILNIQKDEKVCCLIIQIMSDNVNMKICSTSEVEQLEKDAAVNEVIKSMKTLPDGQYEVTIYKDKFYAKSQGLYAYADVLKNVDFTDKYVSSLKPGDMLKMPKQYEYGDIFIEYMERSNYMGETILLADGCYLSRNEDGSWRLRGHNDIPYKYVSESALICFAEKATIIDAKTFATSGQGVPDKKVNDARELFESPHVYNEAEVTIKIKDGKVIYAYLPYTP